MLEKNLKEIDLSYLFPTILIDSQPDFQNVLEEVELLPRSESFNTLHDIYLKLQDFSSNIKKEFETYIEKGGVKGEQTFPHHPFYVKSIYQLYKLFEFTSDRPLKESFVKVKHNDQAELALVYYQGKLALAYKSKGKKGGLAKAPKPVFVDFLEGKTAFRINANVKSEAVVKACLHKDIPAEKQFILDATGGFGQDAMLLAQTGAHVTVLERNPIIALLLADGLRRLKEVNKELKINLIFPANITEAYTQKQLAKYNFHTLYLDPMFPHKGKSAKVNKNMQLIQEVVGQDLDADSLLEAAFLVKTKNIVVKRPKGAPFLANRATKNQLTTPSHRFDYYFANNAQLSEVRVFSEKSRITDYKELVDFELLKSLAKPEIEGLAGCRRRLHLMNLGTHFTENATLYDAYVGYHPYLEQETVLCRIISEEQHECAQLLYRQSNELQPYYSAIPGNKLARLISYTMHPEKREEMLKIIAEKFPEAEYSEALFLEYYCKGIRQNIGKAKKKSKAKTTKATSKTTSSKAESSAIKTTAKATSKTAKTTKPTKTTKSTSSVEGTTVKGSKYSLEFKEKMVKLVAEGHTKVSLSKEYGVATCTLTDWCRAAEKASVKASSTKKASAKTQTKTTKKTTSKTASKKTASKSSSKESQSKSKAKGSASKAKSKAGTKKAPATTSKTK